MHYLPTRVIFGDQAVRRGYVYLNLLGKKALLITGKSSALQSGALKDVLHVLDELQIEHILFDQVTENPTLELVMQGAAAFNENGCDFLIGIGGGSPIDTAKAISLVSGNQLAKDDIYNLSLFKRAFPVVAVPTTAGTGTEVTQYAVLTNPETGKKAGFGHDLAYPGLALVDPKYTLSLPSTVTLNTSLDALSHLLESIYSNHRTPMIYPLVFQGVKLILDNLKLVLQHPENLAGRTALMQASLYGGIGISHSSTTFQHSIGYPLTTEYGIPHGLANGIVMQPVMELYYPQVKDELDSLFEYLRITKSFFFDWLNSLDLSTGITVTEDFIATRVPEIQASRNMANNPVTVTAEDIAAILRQIR